MSVVNDEKKEFLSDVTTDFIDMIKEQIKTEEKVRQFKLIMQLADKYRKGDPKGIADFIDAEKRSSEKDKNNQKTNIENLKEARRSLYLRNSYIPMLELESCIITTEELPKSLYPKYRKEQSKDLSNSIELLKKKNFDAIEMKEFFNIPFETNLYQNLVDSNTKDPNIKDSTAKDSTAKDSTADDSTAKDSETPIVTQAEVIITALSFKPTRWVNFLDEYKTQYIKNANLRYSLLYFLTKWYEMRPKHFIKMFPHLIPLIEDLGKASDGGLLVKHLRLIFSSAKRNMLFKFLPLDSIPSTFHLNYIQASDYHKIISGNDVSTMQNSFKSNMLKRFDLTSDDLARREYDSKNDNKNDGKNDNKNDNKNDGKNDNKNDNKNDANNSYPNQPTFQDIIDATIILIASVQNALSLDCFITSEIVDDNILPDNEAYKRLDRIDLSRTFYLKEIFSPEDFEYWKNNIKMIRIGQGEIQKLKAILEGFSNWVVDSINNAFETDAKSKNKAKEPKEVLESILYNVYWLTTGVSKLYNKRFNEIILKIDFSKIWDKAKETFNNTKVEIQLENNQKKNITFRDFELSSEIDVLSYFLSDEQVKFKMKNLNNISPSEITTYDGYLDCTHAILTLLKMKPKVDDIIHMGKYEILSKRPDNLNHNDKNQQYVDPWAIRIVFYHFTKFILPPPDSEPSNNPEQPPILNNKDNFNFDI